jgi:hypothetical protein
VAGDDCDVVGQCEQAGVDGVEEFAGVAAGKVGAADGAREEGVSGEEEGLLGKVEADAAFCVAGSVEDGSGEAGDGDDFAVVEGVVGRGDFGGGDAEPAGLDGHDFDLSDVVLVVEDGGAGELLEAEGAGDVVDVGVGDDDLLDGELVLLEEGDDAGDVGAGIDDDGFVGGLVTEDGAVALEWANGEDFVDHARLSGLRGISGNEKCASRGPAHLLELKAVYFLAGVLWVVLAPERTEWSPDERARRMVRPMEVSMKRMAE